MLAQPKLSPPRSFLNSKKSTFGFPLLLRGSSYLCRLGNSQHLPSKQAQLTQASEAIMRLGLIEDKVKDSNHPEAITACHCLDTSSLVK